MEVNEIREKLNGMIRTRKDIAESIGIEYVYFTRFLNGAPLGKDYINKIENWLRQNKLK